MRKNIAGRKSKMTSGRRKQLEQMEKNWRIRSEKDKAIFPFSTNAIYEYRTPFCKAFARRLLLSCFI